MIESASTQSATVQQAAQWLADQTIQPVPIIPNLRQRFNLSAMEACEACAMADRFRIVRRAFG